MRTLKELKEDRKKYEEDKIFMSTSCKDKEHHSWVDRFHLADQEEKSLKRLDNLDEAIEIEIAYYANMLYNQLLIEQAISSANLTLFAILEEYLEELNVNPKCFYSKEINKDLLKVISYFGFEKEDLKEMYSQASNLQFRDELVNFINNFYGTSIPLNYEWDELMSQTELSYYKQENMKLSLLKLRNGELVDSEIYPLVYRQDIVKMYENSKTKRKTKK